MGPFEWLAGRWTPEFEYRDRLADEVEDIAYESTRIGARRGFLVGALIGAILVMIGVSAMTIHGLQTNSSPAVGPQESHQQATTPQPAAEELSLLRQENEQLKKELARAKAAGTLPPREKGAVETRPPQAKAEGPASRLSKTVVREPAAKPEAKAKPPSSIAAQPIPSNCRKDGVCDPVGR